MGNEETKYWRPTTGVVVGLPITEQREDGVAMSDASKPMDPDPRHVDRAFDRLGRYLREHGEWVFSTGQLFRFVRDAYYALVEKWRSEKLEKLHWMSRAAMAYAKIEFFTNAKVEIRDGAIFEKLQPEAIEAYLTKNGWQYHTTCRRIAKYWRWGNDDESPWLLLPWAKLPIEDGKKLGDHHGRIVDIVRDLAEIEDRSELAVCYDILEGGDE